jgi:asparagine synthase (glutamine-hydrolysing)
MTHFVAAWVPPGKQVDPRIAERLTTVLSRAGDTQCVRSPRCVVVHWDSKLWPGDSAQSDGERSIVVAGDPVVVQGSRTLPRPEAITYLREHAFDDPDGALNAAQGSYAAVVWNPAGDMRVATDKLGIRAIYWAQAGGVVYVSTARWALDELSEISAEPDYRGIVETCAFGVPLADRTLTSAIRTLGAGEFIDLCGHAAVVRRYWDWATVRSNGVRDADLPRFITDAFNQAVDSRLYGQDRVFAFLSGGMDSRIVVSRLKARGADVCALNFAPPGSQDLLFGRMAAEAMGVRLFEFDDDGDEFMTRRSRAFKAWEADPVNAGLKPAYDRLVWSGDGGSVGLGHVYLSERIVASARSGNLDATALEIQQFNRYGVSPRSFAKPYRDLAHWPLEAIKEDLRSRSGVEPGRNAHLFFMLNDQRRHLAIHYESLHEHRLDLIVPFFDARFLEAVLSSPVDPFLLHRLYNRLMAEQPFGLGRVPWQVYPGHEPCPAAPVESARLQWKEGWFDAGTSRRNARGRMLRSLRFVLSPRFPADVLDRKMMACAAAVGTLGLIRYEYLLNPIVPVCAAARIRAD